jgi:hypothetical protein
VFNIGDIVEYLNEAGSTGFISDIGTYEGFSSVTFISGGDIGKTYNVNNAALRLLSDDKEEPVVEVKESPSYSESLHPAEKGSASRAPRKTDVLLPKEPTRYDRIKPAIQQVAAAPATKKWSKVQIIAMIKEKPGAVERGILCLNKHQQRIPEKSRSYVSYWAEYIMKGKALSGRHLFNARRTCYFNAAVLVDAANGVI